jgi:kumamolisin
MKNVLRYIVAMMMGLHFHGSYAAAEAFNLTTMSLPGHIPSKAMTNAVFLGPLDVDKRLPLTFVLPLRNQEELETLVLRMHDPNDQEYYGKYLTTEEFIERFAPKQEDYDRVIAYANSIGLRISETHANRMLLKVSGTAKTIEAGFNLTLNRYKLKSGRHVYAPNRDPEVPAYIASTLKGVVGLDTLAKWHPYHHRNEHAATVLDAHDTVSYPSGIGGGYAPNDLVIAYNLSGVNATGSGESIALFELAGYQESDIDEYTNAYGLPNAKLTDVLVSGGSDAGIDAEVTLDIELALALAPESRIYVYEGPNTDQGVLATYNRIATDNLAKQVSSSWGLGEDLSTLSFLQAEYAIFLQMAANGQTIYAAAGDSGAYDDYPYNRSLSVDDPASQPYVVGVGGTCLKVNAQTCAIESETVWNDGFGNGAGGGGVSKVWSIPSWQTNVPSVFSKTHRNVPDVSLNADPDTGYSIYYDGEWQIFGGTSCAAPLWAAFTARVNQERSANHLPSLGFANPVLYSIAAGKTSATDFNDVKLGNNLYYRAKVSYDNATGWGSFNGANLFGTLTNPSVTPTPQQSPVLEISMTPENSFKRGKRNSYKINVSNSGNAATTGPVTVTITLPNGLIYQNYQGSQWSYNKNNSTFTYKRNVKPGASFNTLTVNVSVSKDTPSSVESTATVSGGGAEPSTASAPTNIRS